MSYTLIDTVETLDELIKDLTNTPMYIGADIETTGLDCFLNKILLFQLNIGDKIFIVDVRKLGYANLTRLVSSLKDSGSGLIFHNAKFDLKFLAYATGIMLPNIYDTQLVEVLLNSGKGKQYYSLAELTEKYTDYFMEKETRSEFIDFPENKPFTEKMLVYSAMDVKVLPLIYVAQLELLNKTFQTKVAKVENELLPVVAQMELDGIKLNVPSWLEVKTKAEVIRDTLYIELKEMISSFAIKLKADNGLKLAQALKIPVKGKARCKALEDVTDISLMKDWVSNNFNPRSSTQMKAVFWLMGMKVKDTNEKTIEKITGHPLVDLILKIRAVNKQIDSYGDNVVQLIHPVTGKIHTEYQTIGTATGRFSSKNPNMQNVPTHGGYRECFIPDDGFVFISVDYSQQEYRLAGAVSREPRIINAYKQGSDMHTATAQIIYNKDVVTKDERSRGKTVNFAILYGSTEYGLQRNLEIPLEQAKDIIKTFWDGYPALKTFMDMAGNKIMELGFSSTPYGRRRYNVEKPLYLNSNELVKWRERVLREGKNHIIQGGGADILKIAMLEINRKNPFGRDLRMLLQIHDELVFMVKDEIKVEAGKFVRDIMEDVEQRFLGQIPAKTEGWDEYKDKWSK